MKLPTGGVRSNVLAGAAIAGAAALAYGNSGSGAFVFDDRYSIVENASIRHLWPLWSVLTPNHGGMTVSGRPLVNLSLAVNYALGGLDPRGYHLFNLIVHVLAGLTLFGLARRVILRWSATRPDPDQSAGLAWLLALAAALLWTLHPLQTESVTYVVQRTEAMMGFFYLLTLYGFVRYAGEGLRRWAWVSALACLLGMACKEVMVSAPVFVFLCDRTLVAGSFGEAWRRRRGYYLALAATWLPLAACVIAAGNRGDTSGVATGIRPADYWLTQFHAVARYLELAFWPRPLIFDYGTVLAPSVASVAPAAAAVLLLAGASVTLVWRRPLIPGFGNGGLPGLAGLWFFAILAPTCLVPGNRQTLAEHRMYLALAPVMILSVLVIGRVLHRHRLALGALLAGWAVALGTVTHGRNRDYRSELALYGDTVAKLPGNYLMQCGLGYALIQAGRIPEAEAHYREALRIEPAYAEAHVGLADALVRIPGGLAEAIAEFRQGLRLNPRYFDARVGLAEALLRTPDGLPEAVAQFDDALRLRPDDAEVHNALAVALARIPGRESEALAEFGQALRLEPNYRAAHHNLAILYVHTGQIEEAIREMETILKLEPDDQTVRNDLARLRALPR